MRALGYEQNMLAHAQRRQRAAVVGISVPHVDSAYLAALIESFEDIAAVRGYQVMQVLTRRDPQVELRGCANLLRHRIAGLLLVPTYRSSRDPRTDPRVRDPGGARGRPSGDPRFDEVTFNNREVMRDATGRLIELGHRRILFVVQSQRLSISRLRIEALARERPPLRPSRWRVSVARSRRRPRRTRPGVDGGACRGADDRSPSSSATASSRRAHCGCCKGWATSYSVEISLLAFEEPEWAELTSPQLSVIRQPVKAIAREAWELLLRRMHGEAFPVQRLELHAEIVLRGSVQAVPRERRRASRVSGSIACRRSGRRRSCNRA